MLGPPSSESQTCDARHAYGNQTNTFRKSRIILSTFCFVSPHSSPQSLLEAPMAFRPSRRSPERPSVDATSPTAQISPSLHTRKTVTVVEGDGTPKLTTGKKRPTGLEQKTSSVCVWCVWCDQYLVCMFIIAVIAS